MSNKQMINEKEVLYMRTEIPYHHMVYFITISDIGNNIRYEAIAKKNGFYKFINMNINEYSYSLLNDGRVAITSLDEATEEVKYLKYWINNNMDRLNSMEIKNPQIDVCCLIFVPKKRFHLIINYDLLLTSFDVEKSECKFIIDRNNDNFSGIDKSNYAIDLNSVYESDEWRNDQNKRFSFLSLIDFIVNLKDKTMAEIVENK